MASETAPLKIGINGFGRIGRLVTRVVCGKANAQVVAINGALKLRPTSCAAVPPCARMQHTVPAACMLCCGAIM